MNLVRFLLFGALLSIILGEFGHYPFGSSSVSISLLDILVSLADLFFLVWVVVNHINIRVPKGFVFISLFWLVGFISLIFSVRLFPLSDVLKGSLYLIRYIIYSFVFLITFNLQYRYLNREKFVNWLINIGIVISLLGLVQLLILPSFDTPLFPLIDYGFDPHQVRLTSTFLDPNFVGIFLALIFGLTLYQLTSSKNKMLWMFYLVLCLTAIVLTYSRSAYLTLVTFLSVFLISNWRSFRYKIKVLILVNIVLAPVVIFLLFPRFYSRIVSGLMIDKSSAQRLISWQAGVQIFQQRPIFGVGFDNIRFAKEKLNLIQIDSQNGGHSGAGIDSSFISVLASTGIAGALLYLFFWWSILRNLWFKKALFSKIIFSLLIGLLLGSQFINSLFFPPIMLVYFVLVGVGVGIGVGEGD